MTESGEESSLHPSLIQQYTVTAQTAIMGSHLAKKTLIVTSVPLFERFEVRIKFLSIKNQPGVGSLLAQEVSFWNYPFESPPFGLEMSLFL